MGVSIYGLCDAFQVFHDHSQTFVQMGHLSLHFIKQYMLDSFRTVSLMLQLLAVPLRMQCKLKRISTNS